MSIGSPYRSMIDCCTVYGDRQNKRKRLPSSSSLLTNHLKHFINKISITSLVTVDGNK